MPTPGHYVGNAVSKVFHLPTCGTLPTKNRLDFYGVTREYMIEKGYRPCSRCKP
ncbi:MAG: hypothetical protein LBI44_08030 [Oscillospiraceae bacterium]|nr:hypothetical protein [Oscillospiraceae bacterium]